MGLSAFTLLSAGQAVFKGVADSQAQGAEANRLDAEARLADTQALQRDTNLRGELDRTLSSIAAARAANGLSALSPNALKLFNEHTRVSSEERQVQTSDDRQKAANMRAAAKSRRRGSSLSLITGAIAGGIPIAQSRN